MLKMTEKRLYKVKGGQTLRAVAAAFCVTEYALVAENGLQEELYEGQLLQIPESYSMYTVQEGDTKALLCGSEENFKRKNGRRVWRRSYRWTRYGAFKGLWLPYFML